MDTNGDGVLDKAELRAGLSVAGLSVTDEELDTVFEAVDDDQSGEIDFGPRRHCAASRP